LTKALDFYLANYFINYMSPNSNFDSAANQYDSDFTHTEIGKMQRRGVYHFLNKKTLTPNSISILEINCGTGEDAIWFSKKGHTISATDASSGMIDVAKQKSKAAGIPCTREAELRVVFN
jgi:ubiquinone/menaquinone biosynthesis C-methylase UbiE